jgi:hypothetical protein
VLPFFPLGCSKKHSAAAAAAAAEQRASEMTTAAAAGFKAQNGCSNSSSRKIR